MTRAALLTPDEAARELSVSEKHLRALTDAGQIRYVNISLGAKRERRRYDPQDLDQFREARKCLSTSGQAPRHTAMTSVVVGIDFQARRDARLAGQRNNTKKPPNAKPRPQRPEQARP